MSISLKTQKMLWGKAAGRCSMPECRLELVHDATETDDETLVGENCHIVAESDTGPRANPNMAIEQRNTYTNLILLCNNHHKVIDSQENEYTIQRLNEIKQAHEKWVREQLGFDDEKQRDEETYAGIIDKWSQLAHLDSWDGWTQNLAASPQPHMHIKIDKDLENLHKWLLNRIWPKRYFELEYAFKNFQRVLEDFQYVFRRNAESSFSSEEFLQIKRFYRIREWNPERYNYLTQEFLFHVELIQDLALELTRAANLICHRIRQVMMRSYRTDEGHLTVASVIFEETSWKTRVILYSSEEQKLTYPYRGLKEFMEDREKRDFHFGTGVRDISLF